MTAWTIVALLITATSVTLPPQSHGCKSLTNVSSCFDDVIVLSWELAEIDVGRAPPGSSIRRREVIDKMCRSLTLGEICVRQHINRCDFNMNEAFHEFSDRQIDEITNIRKLEKDIVENLVGAGTLALCSDNQLREAYIHHASCIFGQSKATHRCFQDNQYSIQLLAAKLKKFERQEISVEDLGDHCIHTRALLDCAYDALMSVCGEASTYLFIKMAMDFINSDILRFCLASAEVEVTVPPSSGMSFAQINWICHLLVATCILLSLLYGRHT